MIKVGSSLVPWMRTLSMPRVEICRYPLAAYIYMLNGAAEVRTVRDQATSPGRITHSQGETKTSLSTNVAHPA